MSRENVEVVRRIWDLYAEGVADGRPEVIATTFQEGLVAQDATFTPAPDHPGTRTYVGVVGFTEFIRSWVAAFGTWRIEIEQIIDAGEDQVVAVIRQSGEGRVSGAPAETRFGTVYRLVDGQVVDRRDYSTPQEALEAVGLRE
jgi:ketosteroid isomerase-like protein